MGCFDQKKWGFLTKNACKIAPNDPRELRVYPLLTLVYPLLTLVSSRCEESLCARYRCQFKSYWERDQH